MSTSSGIEGGPPPPRKPHDDHARESRRSLREGSVLDLKRKKQQPNGTKSILTGAFVFPVGTLERDATRGPRGAPPV